jgi:hypothetical protein
MGRQVLTISPDGTIAGLQVKPGKGFDLRQMGRALITRASEVLFSEAKQQWYVEVRDGRAAGRLIDQEMVASALAWDRLPMGTLTATVRDVENVLVFEEYDDAVAAEIAVLDGLRERGLL